MTSLTPEQLAEIKSRSEKATAGPWNPRLLVMSDAGPQAVHISLDLNGPALESDKYFISHSRQDIPALLAHIDSQESKLQTAREALGVVEGNLADVPFGNVQKRILLEIVAKALQSLNSSPNL